MNIKIVKINDYENNTFNLRRTSIQSVGDIYKDITGTFLVLSKDENGYRFFDFKGENTRDYFNSPEDAKDDLVKNYINKIGSIPYDYIMNEQLDVVLNVDMAYPYRGKNNGKSF